MLLDFISTQSTQRFGPHVLTSYSQQGLDTFTAMKSSLVSRKKEQGRVVQQGSAHIHTFPNEGILHTVPHTRLYLHF